MTALVGSGRIPTPHEFEVYFGLGLVAIGVLLLWYRRDLYRSYQWVIRYPDHGFAHFIVQFVAPVVVLVCGLVLIARVADS